MLEGGPPSRCPNMRLAGGAGFYPLNRRNPEANRLCDPVHAHSLFKQSADTVLLRLGDPRTPQPLEGATYPPRTLDCLPLPPDVTVGGDTTGRPVAKLLGKKKERAETLSFTLKSCLTSAPMGQIEVIA